MEEQITNMIKLKFIRNRVTLKVTNNTHETVTFEPTGDNKHFRFEIFGLLQNKARCVMAEFK